MSFRFVEEHYGSFPTDRLCRVMNVSPRGLRAIRNRPVCRGQRTDMVVPAHILEQSLLSLQSYGRTRITEELKEVGVDVGHRPVGRLKRENGIIVERKQIQNRGGSGNDPGHHFPDKGPTAIRLSTSHPTC